MNFIIDAQLPRSLAEFLCSKGYDAIHTLNLPEQNKSSDNTIIEVSVKQERVIVSQRQ